MMSITAAGEVMQRGIQKSVEYVNLIRGSFPRKMEQTEKPN
jgi:hypothetical protein